MPNLLLLFVMKYQQRSFLRLIPMVAYMLKLIPMGVTAPKLNPMGVVRIFDEDEEEEEEVPLIRKNSRHYRGSRGIVIFLLQLCPLLSAFKNCQ
jgi:hypothetical protein